MRKLLFAILTCCFTATNSVAQTPPTRATTQINSALEGFFGAGGEPTVSPEAAAAVDPSRYGYRFNPQISEQVRREFLGSMDAHMPSNARKAMRDMFAQLTPQLLNDYVKKELGTDWTIHNVADALTIAIVGGFEILQDIEQATPRQRNAVRGMIRVAMKDSGMASRSDAEKQKAAEAMVLSAVVFAVLDEGAKESGDPAMAAAAKDSVRFLLAGFGLHPAIFQLGPEGLEQTAKIRELGPRIKAGEMTLAEGFPEIAADYRQLGDASKAIIPGVVSEADDTDLDVDAAVAIATPMPALPPSPAPLNTGADMPVLVNPLGAPPATDPIAGRYSDDTVLLLLTGRDGEYTGKIEFQGQVFPIAATGGRDLLTGQFTASGQDFVFEATLSGRTLRFETGGRTYFLDRAPPRNPLGAQ